VLGLFGGGLGLLYVPVRLEMELRALRRFRNHGLVRRARGNHRARRRDCASARERSVDHLPRPGHRHAVEHFAGTDATIAYLPDRPSHDFDDVVPPAHYAVFGDNRDNARDTRYIGFVPGDHIVGRVVKVVRPGKN
jgi:hypothetical protein